jgi:hypothetical protein
MFESGFPDASGREEGLMRGLDPGLGPVSGYPDPLCGYATALRLVGRGEVVVPVRWQEFLTFVVILVFDFSFELS